MGLCTPTIPGDHLAGGWRLEAGGWRLEAGGWRLEAGGWRLEAGSNRKDAKHAKSIEGSRWPARITRGRRQRLTGRKRLHPKSSFLRVLRALVVHLPSAPRSARRSKASTERTPRRQATRVPISSGSPW
ncbi:hypothetical protein EBL84_12200 [Marichromatium sp. AB31]|nr:hypothetical protein EBL84_12200 [Marichromatium sp. AB31]